jgi:predicted amidohydrolase YtcJ
VASRGIVFRNGSVFDGERFAPPGTAVLIEAGRIANVGTGLTPDGAEVVDLDGGTLLPGFIDSHAHPVFGGNQLRNCDLSDAETEAGYLKVIADYASGNPDKAWITGGGWGMPAFPGGIPSRHSLDAITRDRPVYLQNRDGHGAWVNTRALELAGIGRHTPDPADGRIERDEHGDAIGMLQEGAMQLSRACCRRPPRTTFTRACSPRRATCSRSASPAGRTRSLAGCLARTTPSPRTGARRATARSSRTWSARCGGTGIRASSSSRTCCTCASGRSGSARPASR